MANAAPTKARLSKVLIVDDEASICELVSDACRREGISALAATSSSAALEILDHQHVDVLVCDLKLGDGDGMHLMERCTGLARPPRMLVLTAYGSLETAQRALRMGAYDYITKPFEVRDLLQRIQAAAMDTRQRRAADGAAPPSEWARDAAMTDALTGLYSHRYFQEELHRARRYCQRFSHTLSLLLLDVDDFGQANRRFGHRFGDEMLRRLSETLRQQVRSVDLVGRFGGDEFALLMPETGASDAIKTARRLCLELSHERFRLGDRTLGVTISGGLATCDSGFIESEEELVRRASEALKAAKRAGKDRLVTWNQVLNTEEALSADRAKIEQVAAQFESLTVKLKGAYFDSARTLVAAVEAKDRYTCHHSMMVAEAASNLARRLGLPDAQVESIHIAATLHDIGKIGIPDRVLNKPAGLTDEEYELVKQHPQIGVSILENARLFRAEIPIIRHHHERWDGHGYPAGLAGTDIPLGARILAVCDSVDAMLSNRAYRRRLRLERVIEQLAQGAGTQFDPDVVKVALEWLEEEGAELYASADRPRQVPVSARPATPGPRPASSTPN